MIVKKKHIQQLLQLNRKKSWNWINKVLFPLVAGMIFSIRKRVLSSWRSEWEVELFAESFFKLPMLRRLEEVPPETDVQQV